MNEQPPNPYESPQAPTPPIKRLGRVNRIVAYAWIICTASGAFVVCCGTACIAGETLLFSVGRENSFFAALGFAIMFGGAAVAVYLALMVARVLARRINSEE